VWLGLEAVRGLAPSFLDRFVPNTEDLQNDQPRRYMSGLTVRGVERQRCGTYHTLRHGKEPHPPSEREPFDDIRSGRRRVSADPVPGQAVTGITIAMALDGMMSEVADELVDRTLILKDEIGHAADHQPDHHRE
jgi:hypothetical protein